MSATSTRAERATQSFLDDFEGDPLVILVMGDAGISRIWIHESLSYPGGLRDVINGFEKAIEQLEAKLAQVS